MKKRLLMILATLMALFVLSCAMYVSATQADCLCGNASNTDAWNPCAQAGHKAITWTDWSGTTLPTASGNYRLTDDVALTTQWAASAGDYVFDLAGHSITQTTAGQHTLFLSGTAKVTITDSVGGGKVVGASGSRLIQLGSGTSMNLYGGTLDATAGTAGYGTCMNVNGSTVNMYGGTILGGTATEPSGGGAVILQTTGTFNMYSGLISGGTCSAAEGCGGVITTWDAPANFNHFGGTVEGGKAKFGATVYVRNGTYTLAGGTLNGSSATFGGAVYVTSKAQGFVMTAGTLNGGTAVEGGAAIDVNGGAVSISGGTVNGGTSKYGGAIDMRGASSVTVSGGTVNGSAVTGSGGGAVIIQSGSLKLTGGEIKGGSGEFGGAVYVFAAAGTFEMTGGTLTGGTVTHGGGALDVSKGKAIISGGTIKGGNAQYGGAVNVRDGASMTLSGTGVIDGGKSTGSGGGAVIIQVGTFTMEGGTIKNGNATTGYGGNVFLFSATSKFIMNGGVVESGNANFGGNIMTQNVAGATVQLNGGIVRNGISANNGAAGDVYIYSGAIMQMTGGEIYGGKRVNGSLDSVMIMNATLNMSGGTIHGHSVVQNSSFVLSGDAVIANDARNSGVSLNGTVKPVDLTKWTGDGDVLFNGMNLKIAASGNVKGLCSAQGGVVLVEGDGIYVRPTGSRYGCVCGLNEKGEHFGDCDETQRLWTGWSTATTLPTTTGYYSLATDVALNEVMLVADGADVYLDLNGHTVNGPSSDAPKYGSYRIYDYNSPDARKSLTITDSSADNTGKMLVCNKSNQVGGVIWVRGNAGSTLSIYGGTYKVNAADTTYAKLYEGRTIGINKGTFSFHDGLIDASDVDSTYGAAVYVSGGAGFNMTGGKIIGGNVTQGGGAIHLGSGTSTISGGQIIGGTAQYGGSVNIQGGAALTVGGTVHISGGTATGSGGGNIIVQAGTLTMTGGTVTGGVATAGQGYGGNVLAFNVESVINLNGGTVTEGTANYGGNLFLHLINGGSTATLNGVTMTDGKAVNGAGGNVYAYSGTTLNIAGDTSIAGGLDRYEEGDNIFLYKATLNMSGGTVAGYVHFRNEGTVNLSGSPVIYAEDAESNLWIGEQYMLNFPEPLTEGAKIGLSNSYTGVFTADSCADYADYFVADGNRFIEVTETGALKICRYVVQGYAGGEVGAMYLTLAEAIADTDNTWVQLIAPVKEDVVVSGTVYLDFNGFTVYGNFTGEGTLYGMDSATDEYTCYDENEGLLCGGIEGTVAETVMIASGEKISANNAPGIRRYLAIANEKGYTFHRIYVGITHANIVPGTVSVGYKAMFCGDEMVIAQLNEAKAFGFKLWLDGKYLPVTATMAAEKVVSGKPVTLRIDGYDIAGFGETALNGNVFITLADGTVVESATHTYTFRSLMETLNSRVDQLTAAQNTALQTLAQTYAVAMEGWNIDKILAWKAE